MREFTVKMLLSFLHIILLALGAMFISVQAMEKENNPPSLHWYFEHFSKKVISTPEEEEIFQEAYARTDKRILNCTSEQEVYNRILENYQRSFTDLIHYLKHKCYVAAMPTSTSQAYYILTYTEIEDIDNFYKKKNYNLFKESPVVEMDSYIVLWKGLTRYDATLIPEKNISLLHAVGNFYEVNRHSYTVLQSTDDNIVTIAPNMSNPHWVASHSSNPFNNRLNPHFLEDAGFIFEISENTLTDIDINPLFFLPTFLHQFYKLTTGYEHKTAILNNGTTYYMSEGQIFFAFNDLSLKAKRDTWEIENTLLADIAAIICPPGNQTFSLHERKILYALSLKNLCKEMITEQSNTNNVQNDFLMARIGIILHLYFLMAQPFL